jgi:hypothetical protein
MLLSGPRSSLRAADPPSPVHAAQQAAESWLRLTDSGQYGPSWDGAAQFFKGAVTKDQWVKSITAVRGPLGTLKVRALQSAQHTKALPGAPDGDYVVLQYGTSFENKRSAIETITPMLESDGRWRVSGYYIK